MGNLSLFDVGVGLDIHGSSHTTDLDAHTYALWQTVRTGTYYSSQQGAMANTALAANILYAMPLVVVRAMTIDRLTCAVGVIDAGNFARMGIYNDGLNLYPGALLLDAGVIDVGSTGIKAITINQVLTKGVYWVAVISDGVPQLSTWSYNYSYGNVLGLRETDFGLMYGGWQVAQSYGALPDPFTPGGSLSDDEHFGLAVRVLSLD